jgi:hypothetical protein
MVDVFSQMRGGDKAPVPRKAEAKARRCAPFIKNVDDSARDAARCLTPFGQNPAAAGRRQDMLSQDMLSQDMLKRHAQRCARQRGGESKNLQTALNLIDPEQHLSPCARRARVALILVPGSDQQQIDERDQCGSDAGQDQGIVGAEIVLNIKRGFVGFVGHVRRFTGTDLRAL